ncbi:hypothetical protein [Photobacterium alginatilyticum]|nr:hypothetical protein [Photobacterium alginatilyticum]
MTWFTATKIASQLDSRQLQLTSNTLRALSRFITVRYRSIAIST